MTAVADTRPSSTLATTSPSPPRLVVPRAGFGIQVFSFAGRSLRRSLRTSETIVNTVVFPVLLLLTLLAAFRESVEAFEGGSSVYAQRLVPALIVAAVMFGSFGAAAGLLNDRQSGFMSRIGSLPINPTSMLLGTAVGEVFRALVAVATVVAVGSAFGFRFSGGAAGTVAFVVVGCLVGGVMTWVGLALATFANSLESLGAPLNVSFITLVFFSQGFVPLEAYPDWAQPVVELSPVTAFVQLLDALARGSSVRGPAVQSVIAGAAILMLFGGLAIRRLRARP